MPVSSNPRRRRGHPTRVLLAGAAITTFATGLLTASAALAVDVNRADIKELGFTTQIAPDRWINVTSSGGTQWDTIEPGMVSFGAHVNIDTRHYVFWHGEVRDVGIVLGSCGGAACGGKPLLWADHPMTNDYENQMVVTFSTSKIPVSSATGIATVPHGNEIIRQCNSGTPGEERTFDYLMPATFVADTIQASATTNDVSGSGRPELGAQWQLPTDHDVTQYFWVKVRCKPFEPSTSMSEPPPPNPHRTQVSVKDIKLFLSTYRGPESGPSGTTCKRLKVTTRIETDKAGPMNVRLWRQVNSGPITHQDKRMEAEALGGGKYGDEWNKFEQFTQTTTVKYMAEMLGGTFAPSTPWKSITIHCNGDYAPPPQSSTNPDDDLPPAGKPQGRPTAELPVPPVIVTPPPQIACATGEAATRGASTPCIKTAPLPDRRKAATEAKRKAAQEAAERRRKAQQENDLRRRNAELEAELEERREIVMPRRPLLVGPGNFGRLTPNPPPRRRLGVSVMPMFLR